MTAGFQTVSSSGGGWSNYVYTERPEKDVSLLYGDLELGDAIVDNGKWKSSATNIVLSFDQGEGQKLGEEKIKKIVEQFIIQTMKGHKRDEFHVDAVLHKDTKAWHVHIRIPKMNLKTGNALDVYLHSRDKKRLDLITNYLEVKHNLVRKDDRRKLVPDFDKATHINKVRADHKQPSFDFSKKKARDASKDMFTKEILDLVENRSIDSFEQLQDVIKNDFGLKIVKQDFDQTKQQHYLTIANDTGKVRVMGELYSKDFYDDSKTDRSKQVGNNKVTPIKQRRSRELFDKIHAELKIENGKRVTYLDKQLGKAREKAEKKRDAYIRTPDGYNRSADSKPILRPTLTTTNHKIERVTNDRDTETIRRENEALRRKLESTRGLHSEVGREIEDTRRRKPETTRRLDNSRQASEKLRDSHYQFRGKIREFGERLTDFKERVTMKVYDLGRKSMAKITMEAQKGFKRNKVKVATRSRGGRSL